MWEQGTGSWVQLASSGRSTSREQGVASPVCVCVVNDVMFASVGIKDLLVTFPLAWV